MTTFRIDIDDRQFVEYFNQLGRKLGDLRPAMDALGALLESRVHLRFDTKTDPAGAAWTPWAPSTAKQRAKSGRGTLLEQTRRMLDSLTHVADEDWLEVGFGVPYAAAHEFGAHVQVAARSQRAYFRQGKDGTVGNRFVKKSKSNFAQWVTIPAHGFDLPARRMLTADGENLGRGDRAAILARLRAWIEEGL